MSSDVPMAETKDAHITKASIQDPEGPHKSEGYYRESFSSKDVEEFVKTQDEFVVRRKIALLYLLDVVTELNKYDSFTYEYETDDFHFAWNNFDEAISSMRHLNRPRNFYRMRICCKCSLQHDKETDHYCE